MNLKTHAATLGLLVAALSLVNPAPAQAQPQAAPTAAAQGNPITQALAQQGISKCLGRVEQITNYLTANTQSGVMTFTAPAEADRQLASLSMEIQAPNVFSYASAAFSPGAGPNECSAMYEAVTYWNNTCNDVGRKAFGNFKVIAPLRQGIASLDGGPTLKVFLIPAGEGCISVKKEMVY